MKGKLAYLIAGIAATVVFWLFRVALYELPYYNQGFTNAMWNNGVYEAIAAITIAMGWGAAAIYYYAINSVRFDRWWHWLAVMAVTVVLTPVVCYLVAQAMLSGMDYAHEAVQFQFYNLAVVAVLYVVASFSIKWWSSNCRHSPF